MLNRAYSLLEIKSVDEDQRIIEGIASTPSPDRSDDIMEPKGAEFSLPMPFLWHHDKYKPIGEVFEAKVTSAGIAIKARIAKIADPGSVKDRVDSAWQDIKARLVKGLSIGFLPIEAEPIQGSRRGGMHFKRWGWHELSAVTIPDNAQASIHLVKSLDAEHVAASGQSVSTSSQPAGVSASPRVVQAIPKDRHAMQKKKTIADQIKDFENTRAAKVAERDAIMDTAAESDLTLDPEQRDEYDALDLKVKDIDEHLKRLHAREAEEKAAALPVKGQTPADGTVTRGPVKAEVKSRMPDGLEFAAAVLCKAYAYTEIQKGNFVSAIEVAKSRYPDYLGIQRYIEGNLRAKTAVAGGTTSDSNWATALLEPNQVLVNDFLEFLRPRTLIGRIPGLRRVPFNVTFQSQSTAASASWVGQGKGKPLTRFNTATQSLAFTKIAAIAVITDELARFSRPGAESLVRDELAKAVIERMDLDFIDPDKAASSGINPASITNGLTAGTSAGVSAANALTDIQNLVAPFITGKYPTSELVILMPDSLAFALSLMLNTSGFRSFPDISINGGNIGSLPVITSQYLGNASSYGNMVIVLHAPSIAIADDGSVSIDVSREASIEMSDGPSSDATAGTGASTVSMFQTNSIAIRAEREINWKKLRSDAVKFYDDVNWGSIGSPA